MTEVVDTPEGTPTPTVPAADGVNTFDLAYVKTLRDEAAAHRVAKNEAVEAAKTALAQTFETEKAELTTKFTEQGVTLSARELELAKYKALIGAGIPVGRIDEVVPTLEGATVETLPSRVEVMKRLMGDAAPARVPAVDPSQGGSGAPVIPLNGDPIMEKLLAVIGK